MQDQGEPNLRSTITKIWLMIDNLNRNIVFLNIKFASVEQNDVYRCMQIGIFGGKIGKEKRRRNHA
jgi:hypothetical protein